MLRSRLAGKQVASGQASPQCSSICPMKHVATGQIYITLLPQYTYLPLSKKYFYSCIQYKHSLVACKQGFLPRTTPSLNSNTHHSQHSPVLFHCYYSVRRGVEHCLLQIISLAYYRYTIRPVRQVVRQAQRARRRCGHEGLIWPETVPEAYRIDSEASHIYDDI